MIEFRDFAPDNMPEGIVVFEWDMRAVYCKRHNVFSNATISFY